MKSIKPLLLSVGVAFVLVAPGIRAQNITVDEPKGGVAAPESVLASAKNLYASASYEAALLELSASDPKDDPDQIDTYRALCFLALDRQQEAERTLEAIVNRKPMYLINDAEYSPRLVAMFKDVRKRALPVAAQRLYASAKADFEDKNYAAAIPKLKQLLSVLGDPAVADDSGRLKDLRDLGDGFLKLSEQRAEVSRAVAASPAAVSPATAPPMAASPALTSAAAVSSPKPSPAASSATATPLVSAPAAAPVGPAAYSNADSAIKPPVIVSQAMPEWRISRPLTYVPDRVYSGRLELIIDQQGTVEKATLLKSIWPSYDAMLLQAAKKWRYQPALKDGQPVKFIKYLDITVGSTAPQARQ